MYDATGGNMLLIRSLLVDASQNLKQSTSETSESSIEQAIKKAITARHKRLEDELMQNGVLLEELRYLSDYRDAKQKKSDELTDALNKHRLNPVYKTTAEIRRGEATNLVGEQGVAVVIRSQWWVPKRNDEEDVFMRWASPMHETVFKKVCGKIKETWEIDPYFAHKGAVLHKWAAVSTQKGEKIRKIIEYGTEQEVAQAQAILRSAEKRDNVYVCMQPKADALVAPWIVDSLFGENRVLLLDESAYNRANTATPNRMLFTRTDYEELKNDIMNAFGMKNGLKYLVIVSFTLNYEPVRLLVTTLMKAVLLKFLPHMFDHK